MTLRVITYAAGILIAAAVSLGAQSRPVLGDLVPAYEQGDYLRAVAAAESAASDTLALSRDDRADLLMYWAFSLVALARDEAAVRIFLDLLDLKPETDLNPEFVSPKIIAVFRKAKAAFIQAAVPAAGEKVLAVAPRPSKPGALARTLVWPGWGQSYRGQKKRGRIFKIASVAAVACLGATQIGTYFAHQGYLDARDEDRIAAAYGTYNRWYRLRNLSLNLTVSVWVFGAIDVMMGD